jgi:hypothetical protein
LRLGVRPVEFVPPDGHGGVHEVVQARLDPCEVLVGEPLVRAV